MIYILISHFLLYDLGQRLDINRTRQILDSSWIQEHSAWALVTFSQYLDKIWTDIGQGQTLDITQIRWPTKSLPWLGCKWAMGGLQVGHGCKSW